MQSFNNLLHFAHNPPYGGYHHHNHHQSHGGRASYGGVPQGAPMGPPSNPSTESCPTETTNSSNNSSPTTPGTPPAGLFGTSPGNSKGYEYSSSPKVQYLHRNHNHHHHSIQELIRHFGKKMQNWRLSSMEDGNPVLGNGNVPSGNGTGRRRSSLSVSEEKPSLRSEVLGALWRGGGPDEEFRGRSKSLDGYAPRRKISDCEATYRIYDSILREGTLIGFPMYKLVKINSGALCLHEALGKFGFWGPQNANY